MVKAAPFISAQNAGEFSPRMEARVDYEKYPAAFSRGKNLISLPHGGVTFRPGTRYISSTKTQSSDSRPIPFQPTSGVSYVLEMGAAYIRVYRNQTRLSAANVGSSISNGTFTSNITGWDDRSTGSAAIAHASSSLRLTGASNGYAWAEQDVAIPGSSETEVVIRFQVTTNTLLGRSITVQVGTATTTSNLYQADNIGLGWHTITISPGLSTYYLQFINKNADSVFIDNVEVLDNTPIELTSPYAAADVDGVRWAQVNDVLYLFHDDYPPYKIKRYGDKSWSFERVFFEDGPWLGINPDIDLSERNLVKNPAFDGGLQDWTPNGNTQYDGEQSVVFFKDTGTSGQIIQTISTIASIKHVMHFQIVGSGLTAVLIGTSSGGGEVVASTDYAAGWYSVEFTPGAATIYITFKYGGTAGFSPGVGGAFMYHERHNLLEPSARTGSITVEALGDFAPFLSADVGRLIRFEYPGREPGWGTITAVTDADTVTVYVHRQLPYTTPCETWRLGAWSDTTGWPHAATFFQQRLMPVRTASQPQTIWGSQSQDLENFRPDSFVEGAVTVVDTDALDYTLASEEVSTINWIVGGRRLLVGTTSGQWLISSRGPVLTPTEDFVAEQQAFEETADVAPIKVGNVVLFTERAAESLYDLGYSFEVDGLQAADLNIISDHIASESSISEVVYQRRPFSIAFVRKSNGKLIALTYKREQGIVAATSIEIAGSAAGDAVVESMAVIRGQAISDNQVYTSIERGEVWLQVKRTINGSTTRYFEVMEGFFRGPNRAEYETRSSYLSTLLTAQKDAFYVDAGITYSGVSTATVTGLSHLEGETVKVYGAGVEQADKTVSGGQITAASAATKFQVGLGYSWVLRSLKLPYGSQTGPGVGETKTMSSIVLALLDSGPFDYALDHDDGALTFYSVTDNLGSSSQLFTGEYLANFEGGYSTDPRLWLKGDSPHPFTLLGYSPKIAEHEK